MRRTIFITVLTLAGCSSQGVQQTGFHQYTVTGDWTHRYAKARASCAKLDRKPVPLDAPLDTTRFQFECVNSYEVVQVGEGIYRSRVLAGDMPFKYVTVPASPPMTLHVPDAEPADKEARQRATSYCAKMNRNLEVTDAEFAIEPRTHDHVQVCAAGTRLSVAALFSIQIG